MSIRNAAKAIIVHENKVLLNRCSQPALGDYFTLPGGGQHQYETMEAAVIRECLEETGYTVVPEAFVALYEEINTSESLRKEYPDYVHKVYHIFRCSINETIQRIPTEMDTWQSDCIWVDADTIPAAPLMPIAIRENFKQLLHSESPLYLGSRYVTITDNV